MHGSVQVEVTDGFNNAMVWVDPDGSIRAIGTCHINQRSLNKLVKAKLSQDGNNGLAAKIKS